MRQCPNCREPLHKGVLVCPNCMQKQVAPYGILSHFEKVAPIKRDTHGRRWPYAAIITLPGLFIILSITVLIILYAAFHVDHSFQKGDRVKEKDSGKIGTVVWTGKQTYDMGGEVMEYLSGRKPTDKEREIHGMKPVTEEIVTVRFPDYFPDGSDYVSDFFSEGIEKHLVNLSRNPEGK